MPHAVPSPPPPSRERPAAWRRTLLWAALVALLGVALGLLIVLTWRGEQARLQDETERLAVAAASDLRQRFGRHVAAVQALDWDAEGGAALLLRRRDEAQALMRERRELLRLERRDGALRLRTVQASPLHGALFASAPEGPSAPGLRPRAAFELELQLACASARRLAQPRWSRSYFVPQAGGLGVEVIDLCVPQFGPAGVAEPGYLVATFSLAGVLDEALDPAVLRHHEASLVEGDGTRLVRAGAGRGAGAHLAERLVDLPGLGLVLRLDSVLATPAWLGSLPTTLVLALSLALAGVVALLVHDVRRRARAERRLASELALRRAMEDSLLTGLRARDPEGRITYVNPAFCTMVGFAAEELIGQALPPYWPPEQRSLYAERWAERLAGQLPPREGFETIFMRADGERFPVMVFEAPLVDAAGRPAGWMSAVLDVSAQRRAEELARQQQEKLQTAARLASVGEIATLLSHELNQPLAAIASYATGSLNLLDGVPPADDGLGRTAPPAAPEEGLGASLPMIREALERIAAQARRAGRVIQGVHDVVRRREQPREAIAVDQLFEAVLPLIRLQARKSGTEVQLDLPRPPPQVVCDRTMVEQVLLNLSRNAVQAMDGPTPPEQRRLRLRARIEGRQLRVEVIDRGPGIDAETSARLFTPFFTTKHEGLGLGLNFCRSVVEQHGGTLRHGDAPDRPPAARPGLRGSCFSFTLPLASAA